MQKMCECGCGKPAPIARQTRPKWGHVKGEPVRFVPGHNRRGCGHLGEGRGVPASAYSVAADGCWIWQGKSRSGTTKAYGLATVNGRRVRAHRAVYEQLVGPIPDGYVLHHACEEKLCVNPAHLEAMLDLAHRRAHAA